METTFKEKIKLFAIFFAVVSCFTFSFSHWIIKIGGSLGVTDGFTGDGSNDLVDMFDAFSGFLFWVIFVIAVVIYLVIILVTTIIFNRSYYKYTCIEQDRLRKSIRTIIWGFSVFGFLLLIIAKANAPFWLISLIGLVIYLPIVIMQHTIFSVYSKKVYTHKETTDEK